MPNKAREETQITIRLIDEQRANPDLPEKVRASLLKERVKLVRDLMAMNKRRKPQGPRRPKAVSGGKANPKLEAFLNEEDKGDRE